MKTKVILWSIVSLVIIGIAVNAFLWLSKPQVLLLKDGTKLTLVGVTQGRHHVPPKLKMVGARNRGGGAFETASNSVVVWILSESKKKEPNQYPNYQVFVYDSAQTACVGAWSRFGGNQIKNGVYLQGFALDAFPRREGKILLRVSARNNSNGEEQIAKGQFVVRNPLRDKAFEKWTAEPIPDTQSDGDLKVTLTKLNYGMPGFGFRRGAASKDPMNQAVLAAFHCEQNGAAVTNWQVMRIETADATGNHVQNNSWSTSRDSNGDATMTYQYGLWPAESPWKLRVEMSRTSGFSDAESWAVTNVPVQNGTWNDLWNPNLRGSRTNAAVAETTLNGIHLKLFPAIQITDQNFGNGQRQGGIRVAVEPSLPDGYRLSIVAEDERGRTLQGWGPNGGGNSYTEQIQNMRGKALNITVALHKSRFVEFTVKPEKAAGGNN